MRTVENIVFSIICYLLAVQQVSAIFCSVDVPHNSHINHSLRSNEKGTYISCALGNAPRLKAFNLRTPIYLPYFPGYKQIWVVFVLTLTLRKLSFGLIHLLRLWYPVRKVYGYGITCCFLCPSQWPRGLRHELYLLSQHWSIWFESHADILFFCFWIPFLFASCSSTLSK
jgi:hypothetical protein